MVTIPKSEEVVDVQLINTTTNITIESSGFVQPRIPGHEHLHLPTFCFLIKHRPSKRAVLFDCGARTNWRDLPPDIVAVIAQADIHIEKSVDEILTEGGFPLEDLNTVIWRFNSSVTSFLHPADLQQSLALGSYRRSQPFPSQHRNCSWALFQRELHAWIPDSPGCCNVRI